MEEKDSEISGPCEEFRICFCGEVPSGSVAWYCIDVSEKTESSTKELNRFSETEHFPSVYYAFLKGCIYSLGGYRSGRTLLNDVWILDIKSLDSFAARGEEKLKEPEKPQKRLKQKLKEPEKPQKRLKQKLKEPEKPQKRGKQPELMFGQPKDRGKFDMPRKIEMGTADPGLKKAAAAAALKKAKAYAAAYAAKKAAMAEAETAEEAVAAAAAAAAAAREAVAAKEAAREAAAVAAKAAMMEKRKVVGPGMQLDDVMRMAAAEKAAVEEATAAVDTLRDFLCLEPEFLTEPLGLRWILGPPMTFARCNPHTMVVDQKLYVLGGFEPNQNQADGWIEVFDPKEKKWESLPSPPDQIHSSVMISGLLKAKKEIIIAKQPWDRHPMKFYFYNIMTRSWSEPLEREAKVHLPPNAGRAVTVGNTLYWISTEEHECTIRAYDLDRNMWFEEDLNTAAIFGPLLEKHEHFSSIYSSRPGFLHLRDQKFCLLLQSAITKDVQKSSIEYLYRVILDISPIYDRGTIEWTTVSVQKYSMDQYIDFLDCMLEDRVSGIKSVDRRGQSTSSNISFQEG